VDLERLKEQLGYLKFGWLVSAADTTPPQRIVLALLTVILLSSAGIALHQRIGRRIHEIGQLSPWKLL
jgi:hypothetical protein